MIPAWFQGRHTQLAFRGLRSMYGVPELLRTASGYTATKMTTTSAVSPANPRMCQAIRIRYIGLPAG